MVACSLALLAARTSPTILVDLAGDCAVCLGSADPAGPGVVEWMESPNADTDALSRLAVSMADGLHLLPRGQHALVVPGRWGHLADALVNLAAAADRPTIIVDAGTGEPDAELLAVSEQSLLVIRPCFLALRRATRLTVRPTAVVLVDEPGRSLSSRDVEHALGVPVIAETVLDPAVARAVDAGLLASRLPRSLAHQLRGAA
ncbi:MAG: hypothetical protein ABIQ39_17160 [Ilumatobacteraceae bacterium]